MTPLPLSLPTYLLFFGWYPQKEMFFNWKKWLHLFPYGREKRSRGHQHTGGYRLEIWWGRWDWGGHLGFLGIISLDAYLHTPHADLQDAAGGRVKVHGEPAGGGDLRVRDGNQVLLSLSFRRGWERGWGRALDPGEQGAGTFCIAAQSTSLPL